MRPSLPPRRRTACRRVLSILSKSPLTSAATIPPRPAGLPRARRSCRASWARRPGRQPSEPSSQSCSSLASRRLATARGTLWSATAGVPLGPRPPSSFAIPPRATGPAWSRPRPRRACQARRLSSRGAASSCAVPPALPGALAWLVCREASRRKAAARRGARGVTTRPRSRAACSARHGRCGVTVGERQVSPVDLARSA